MKKRIITLTLAAAASVGLLTACGSESQTGNKIIEVNLADLIVIESSSQSTEDTSESIPEEKPEEPEISPWAEIAASESSLEVPKDVYSSYGNAHIENTQNNLSIMYVNRYKYGKTAPYPDAERSRFYDISTLVRVVSAAKNGYYELDNGDYIRCEYLSRSPDCRDVIPDYVLGALPDSTERKTGTPSGYNANAALKYAKERWDKDESLCAEFMSECLTAGGLKYDLASATTLYNELVSSNVGFAVSVDLNEDGTAALPEFVKPGDLIFYYCAGENMMVHTAIYNGNTDDGIMRAYAHNYNDSGTEEFVYMRYCPGGCGYPLNKIVAFCFY